ncbi:MAG: hypothetical protein A2Z46_07875 [Nitrospirae bacterium RBG_19FT_COMBO_55_12]|nr:MAG: hypothetical protein A2Z46_07875 [Nitrospirae bacterium RBG_19FT_COMBO_55_12]
MLSQAKSEKKGRRVLTRASLWLFSKIRSFLTAGCDGQVSMPRSSQVLTTRDILLAHPEAFHFPLLGLYQFLNEGFSY